MKLQEILDAYLLEHDLSPEYAAELRRVVRQFSRSLGRDARTSDLSDEPVNRWLSHLQESGRSRETLRNKRRELLTLWRAAYADGHVAEMPRKVRRIKYVESVPECWGLDDIRKLLDACENLKGEFRKLPVPRSLYFRSLFRAKYETGLRMGDMLTLERDWIWPGGYLSLVQHKSGRSHRSQLRETTLADIETLKALLPTYRRVWPAFACRRQIFRAVRKVIDSAGLRGSAKWLRRSSASYVERENPGQGWRHLGHSRPGLDRRHYLSPSIAYPEVPLPTDLSGQNT